MPKPGEEDWRGSIITDEGINRDYLASFDNYHLTQENA